MPVTVTTRYLGEPEKEANLRVRLEKLFKDYAGNWGVSVLGSQQNTIWEMKVTAPDQSSQWVHKFHGESGEHDIEAILTEVRRIAEQTRARK